MLLLVGVFRPLNGHIEPEEIEILYIYCNFISSLDVIFCQKESQAQKWVKIGKVDQ